MITNRQSRMLLRPYRVIDGRRFRLKHVDPAATTGIHSREDAVETLARGVARLRELQEKLYAQDRWGLLLIFQAMDAAGKDGTIKHVMSGVNPQGCQVFSFKAPSAEELDHDFLWRTSRALPECGRIGIFNRSYYEDVLVVRVHRQLLEGQKLPRPLVTKNVWGERFTDIAAFERYLTGNGIAVRKFFLHVSKDEQKRRFLKRLTDPSRNWKFSAADARERRYWKDYMAAYQDMIRHTSAPHAPWFVVPADNKWYTRLVVAAAVIDALEEMNLKFPALDRRQRRELEKIRVALEDE
jgi:PPK2 family polyphosphate:nucleotide phosphotransferase